MDGLFVSDMSFRLRGVMDAIKKRETIMPCRYSVTESSSNQSVLWLTGKNAKGGVSVFDNVTHASDGQHGNR